MDSCLAAWMKPQVFTRTTLASPSEVSSHPDAVSRAASSSESTSLRAQPSVTRLTVRGAERCDTRRAYPGDWVVALLAGAGAEADRKSTRLNSSHSQISYAVF